MKRYNDYMDAVEVSDTLHERLKNLEEPKKKPQPWAKWGAAAAALVLIAGVGAYGLSRGGWDAVMENFTPNAATARPEIADLPTIGTVGPNREDMPVPEPFPVEPPFIGPISPPDWMNWGYEVVEGEMAAYYVCPSLIWTDASAQPQASLDYSLAPLDAIQRDATWDDMLLFMGGEKAMADHLLWDGFTWDGTLWFLKDGTPCGASFSSDWVDGTHLYLEVMKGGKVPSCIVLPDKLYGDNWWQGVEITSLHLGKTYEVSFFCNGTGYKLTLYPDSPAQAAELCGRFVRYAVDGGFSLSVLPLRAGDLPNRGFPPENAPEADILHPGDPGYIEPFPAVPDSDRYFPDCPYCADGTVHTHPYDPNAAAEAKAPTPPN